MRISEPNRLHKRRGNLLIAVVLMMMISSLVMHMLLKSAIDLHKAKYDVGLTTDTYDMLVMADICADALVYDLAAWWEYSASVGDVEYTIDDFASILDNINRSYFDTITDGRLQYKVTNPKDIVEFLFFDDATAGPMQERLELQASKITDMGILLDTPLALGSYINEFDEDDDEHMSGAEIWLQDIVFHVVLARGIRRVDQEYILRNMRAVFSETDFGVRCSIDNSSAYLIKNAQLIT